MSKSFPDRELMESSSPANVIRALHVASAALQRAGIRHAIVGGLAIAAHGYGRSTKDVDFLVGDEAFEHHPGGIVTMRPGVPIQVSGVLVDFLSIDPDEDYLTDDLTTSGDIASANVLVYLKLKSPRAKDRVDIIELVKAGLNVAACHAYLTLHRDALTAKFNECVAAAAAEE
jgi:hypothetical protein